MRFPTSEFVADLYPLPRISCDNLVRRVRLIGHLEEIRDSI